MRNTAALAITPPLTIVQADETDAQCIHELAMRIWPAYFADIIPAERMANMLEKIYSATSLVQQMREGQQFWVAYEGREPVGYMSAFKKDDVLWIKKLYLDETQRGKSYGKLMLDHVIGALQPAHEARLYVHRDNVKAQGFYEKMGFVFFAEEEVMMGDYSFVDKIYRKELW